MKDLKKLSIVIIGAGNIASLFGRALEKKGARIVQVCSHKNARGQKLARELGAAFTDDLRKINRDADLVLIAVNDDAIAGVAKKLQHFSGTVVHTSGSVGMDVLKRSARRGVLYPLQTVSGNRPLRLKNIPLCVEASGKETKKLLHTIAGTLSHDVHDINSGERRKLHLAAVFVNNFSNHLYTLAEEYLRTNRLSFNLLRPLILETAKKAVENSPAKSQTGPAARNDTRTISAHLALLKKNKQMKKIYTDLTASILERSRQKRS